MAIIINTLEVVVDQPGPGRTPPPVSPPKPPPAPLTPRDLEDVRERLAWTAQRLAAH